MLREATANENSLLLKGAALMGVFFGAFAQREPQSAAGKNWPIETVHFEPLMQNQQITNARHA